MAKEALNFEIADYKINDVNDFRGLWNKRK